MGFPAGVRAEMVEYARGLAGVAEPRAATVEQDDTAKALRAETADLRVAVDYYMGHSHTKLRHVEHVNRGNLEIARNAVLTALYACNLLIIDMPDRIIVRLLTPEERRACSVTFIEPVSHQERTVQIGIPFELTGS